MTSFSDSSRARSQGRAERGLRLLALGLSLWLSGAQAAGQTTREYDLKAVFLFNFTQFAEWPATAFHSADEPFVIGVLGDDPFGPVLDEIVRNERVKGRRLTVRRFQFADEVERCHVLYIGRSHRGQYLREMAAWHDQHILTVTDGDTRQPTGVAVEFLTTGGRIRLRIDTRAVDKADVTISSKLLRLAELVRNEP